jgi:hypothetical protein
MIEKEFFKLINKYFSTLSKVEELELTMHRFNIPYSPEYEEECIALETYRREIEYYLPDFLEK